MRLVHACNTVKSEIEKNKVHKFLEKIFQPSKAKSLKRIWVWGEKGLWLIAMCFFSGIVAACAPHFSQYHYLSFEKIEDLQIIETSWTPSRSTFTFLPIPIIYELARETYVLRILIDPYYADTRIYLRAQEDQSDKLLILVNEKKGLEVFRKTNPRDVNGQEYNYLFDWVNGQEKELIFNLENSDGQMVGQERLPFEILTQGFIFGIDSI